VSQTERINRIVHLLETSRYPVTLERFLDDLEISRATFKRDLAYLRDRLQIPIEWQTGEPGQRGYVLATPPGGKPASTIQGLWFNQSEIHALLTMHELASNMDPGLITDQTRGLIARITQLLGQADDDPETIRSRIQILHSASARSQAPWFQVLAQATIRQRRVEIEYYTRGRGAFSIRTVSPKRLLYYRENWYLLAWCHSADALRLFALDAIAGAQVTKVSARRVRRQVVDEFIGSGFGIFGGRARHRAKLRFSATRSRWVRDETWHPKQTHRWDGDRLILEVPYSHEAEIMMEILRHGAEVEVLGPEGLRTRIASELAKAAAGYSQPHGRDGHVKP
jgi:predicted DNA-binding transcriptional regulator YafY